MTPLAGTVAGDQPPGGVVGEPPRDRAVGADPFDLASYRVELAVPTAAVAVADPDHQAGGVAEEPRDGSAGIGDRLCVAVESVAEPVRPPPGVTSPARRPRSS